MKILITGSNGLLGQKVVQALAADPEVTCVATSLGANRLPASPDYSYYSMDIRREGEVEQVFAATRPDRVIHTAAMTNVDACEQDQELCDALNLQGLENIMQACAQHQAHLTHLSTDFIFDGAAGPYAEDAQAAPLSYYGWSKLKGEELLAQSKLSYAIVRTVLVYGVAQEMSRSNIVLWAKQALEAEKPMQVVNDQFRSPTLAEDLAQGCILAAKQRAEGIYHLSGPDQMSVLELVERVADFWQLDKSRLTAVSSQTLSQAAKRPPRTGFIIDKARQKLGYQPHSFEEGLALVDAQLKAARRH